MNAFGYDHEVPKSRERDTRTHTIGPDNSVRVGKIHLEDHRLASRGLSIDDKWLARGTGFFFYLTFTRIIASFSCLSLNMLFSILENMRKASRSS